MVVGEESADLPSYSIRGGSHSMPYAPSESHELAVDAGAHVPAAEETTTPAIATAMGTAVANWADESNGRIEARVFGLTEPLDAESVPTALLTLGLECLHGAGKKKTALSVAVRSPAQAWRVLFAAASTGGAYNSGSYGAYGRLAAWQSLAALAGSIAAP